jgi:hypothetical protein
MSPQRRYPDFYEKAVPIVLGLITLAIIIILGIILGVASGLFSAFY